MNLIYGIRLGREARGKVPVFSAPTGFFGLGKLPVRFTDMIALRNQPLLAVNNFTPAKYLRSIQIARQPDKTDPVVQRAEEVLKHYEAIVANCLSRMQTMAATASVAAGVIHDLKNYLTAVSGWADILKIRNTLSLPTELSSLCNVTQDACNLSLTFLNFFRSQNNGHEVFINNLVESTLPLLKIYFNQFPKIQITSDLAARSLIKAIDIQVKIIILNLAINAGQSLSEQGCGHINIATEDVEISAGRAANFGSIPLDKIPPGRYVVLSVSDDGPGIPEKVQRDIWGFSLSTKATGNGLGLQTVFSYVRENNGFLNMRTQTGKNHAAIFEIYFPVVSLRFEA